MARASCVQPDGGSLGQTVPFHLAPGRQKFELTDSQARGADDEVCVNSRPMMQIMGAFASFVVAGAWGC